LSKPFTDQQKEIEGARIQKDREEKQGARPEDISRGDRRMAGESGYRRGSGRAGFHVI
jgi:hypothetical protein